jgi:hypothetical protein
VLRHDTLKLIDGAGPDARPLNQNKAESASVNGKDPERQTVSENERRDPSQTVETSTSPKCTFSRTVAAIDLKRFTASGVTSVECPLCGRTRSLSPVKGVLRFLPHEPRKSQTKVSDRRWATSDKTDWGVIGGEGMNGKNR